MSENLEPNETHFRALFLYPSVDEELERVIEDDVFGDITFENFEGHQIDKINSNAFNKTAHKIQSFNCYDYPIVNQPPKYNIIKVVKNFIVLKELYLNLNVTEIPKNMIGQHSNLSILWIKSPQNLTIKSGAFQNLSQLTVFWIYDTKIQLIERNALEIPATAIFFEQCYLSGKWTYFKFLIHSSNIKFLNFPK